MIELIVLLLPQSLSVMIHNKINNKNNDINNDILSYLGYGCLVNLILFGLLLFTHNNYFELINSFNNISFVFKTFLVNILLSIICPIIVNYINKIITFKLEIKEKNGKKNK